MKMTNKDTQVGDRVGDDDGTRRLAVCNECLPTSNTVVHTKTDERALAAGGAKCQAK